MCEMPGVYSWIPYESNIEAVDSINSFLFETQGLSNFSELQISSMIIVRVPFLMSTSPTNLTRL